MEVTPVVSSASYTHVGAESMTASIPSWSGCSHTVLATHDFVDIRRAVTKFRESRIV